MNNRVAIALASALVISVAVLVGYLLISSPPSRTYTLTVNISLPPGYSVDPALDCGVVVPSGGILRGGSGTSHDPYVYEAGSIVTLTAIPADNFGFIAWGGWGGDIPGNFLIVTVTMDRDRTIDAIFAMSGGEYPKLQRGENVFYSGNMLVIATSRSEHHIEGYVGGALYVKFENEVGGGGPGENITQRILEIPSLRELYERWEVRSIGGSQSDPSLYLLGLPEDADVFVAAEEWGRNPYVVSANPAGVHISITPAGDQN